ncbi:MAG TPA: alpha-L-fucosidase [Pyrinomonadaceae bacterium]
MNKAGRTESWDIAADRRGLRRRAGAAALTLLLSAFPVWGRQADAAAGPNERDRRAVEEAVGGWWKASMRTHARRVAWWREARFGCFIHWGVYSAPGGEWEGKPFRGYAEHLMRIKKIPLAEYREKVVAGFNPVGFDADEWVRLIKSAGMRYLVITAKHHDGFAMYPSASSAYDIRDATPFRRDPLRELARACRRHGLRFGFYYSHAFDWEHAGAPGNDWDYDNPGGDRRLHGGDRWYDQHPELLARARRYVDEKALPQIRELLVNYRPDIIWFDTPHKLPLSENVRILKAIRETDPNVVVNGRLARGLGHSLGDYRNTSDRAAEMAPTEGDWETIPTTNESYGYHRHDLGHKPPAHFIRLLAKAAARGGNVLMNIGPMGDGRIDPKDREILRGVGRWMRANGESIYGSERTPLPVQPWGESTRKGRTLYLHVFDFPRDGRLVVGGLRSPVRRAYLLADARRRPLKTTRPSADDFLIDLPARSADPADTVVAVETDGEPKANPVRLLAARGHANVLRVFDGDLHGEGLRFGDGKEARAYVFEWKSPSEWVGWRVRVSEPAEFEVGAKYTTASNENRGGYSVNVGGHVLKATVVPTPRESEPATVVLGRVKLAPGEYEIAVRPTDIKGGELMRLFHLSLTPVGLKR